MPRGPRIDAPGTIHHVTFRGIERREIFRDDIDREAFLARLDRLALLMRVIILAWVLMPNHVHLVIGTEIGVLSRFMARLNTSYALYFNRRHGRSGYVFQNRFWSRPIDDDPEMVIEYVHFNPVRAGMVTADGLPEYPWSGHGARVGVRAPRLFERATLPRCEGTSGLAAIVAEECARAGLSSVAVTHGRTRAAGVLRARIVRRALWETRLMGTEVARELGIAPSTVSKIGARVAREMAERGVGEGSSTNVPGLS
jgi:REP element-mobilizing transposase RayT